MHIYFPEKSQLGIAVERTVILELCRQSGIYHLLLDAGQIRSVFRREITCYFQSGRTETVALAQLPISLGQQMQPFLRRDPGKEADAKDLIVRVIIFRPIVLEIYSERADVD